MSTTKLQIRELIALDAALRSLVGHEEGGKTVRYTFDSKTKWNVTKDMRILKGEVEQYQEQRVEKVRELSPVKGNVEVEGSEVMATFVRFHEELLKTTVEVDGLLKLKLSALLRSDDAGLPRNNIPEDVLFALEPVIEDDLPA